MKKIKKRLKCIAYLLMTLMMLQSCAPIYYSSNVTLDEAVASGIPARVVSTDTGTKSFQYLESEYGNYYGVKPQRGKMVRTPLEAENVQSIQLKNKGKTFATYIVIPIVLVGASILALQDVKIY